MTWAVPILVAVKSLEWIVVNEAEEMEKDKGEVDMVMKKGEWLMRRWRKRE